MNLTVELKAPINPEHSGNYLEKVRSFLVKTNKISLVSKQSTFSESCFYPNYNFASYLIKLKPEIEIVFHLTCRDLNKVNIQARLFLLKSLGIKKLLIVTGDNYVRPTIACEMHFLDSNELVSFISGNCNWFESIGVAGYPGGDGIRSRDNSGECARLGKKLTAGANAIYTQCLFDLKSYGEFVELIRAKLQHVEIIPSVAVFDSLTSLDRILKFIRVSSSPLAFSVIESLREQLNNCSKEQAELIALCYLEGVFDSILKLQPSNCTIDLCTFGSYKAAEKLISSLSAKRFVA